jgi:aminoglycoside phosphotransferase (APT) family kinase protein
MSDESWRQLVDIDRLSTWMDSLALGEGPVEEVAQLTGGTQNLLLKFQRAGRWYVLRRPPLHPRVDGTQTMLREARVLGALAETHVPHPRLIAACDDKSVLGAGFYLMEPIIGFTATAGLPASFVSNPTFRHRMGLAMAEGIAELGSVDYLAVGLANFGKADGYLERQAGRWRSQLESYRDYAGWPGPSSLPGVDAVSRWLDAERPSQFTPGIVHGDYHISNVMFRDDAPELAAIIDWELATIGDPLIDLGWLLATWPGSDGVSVVPELEVRPWRDFATHDELITRYGERSTRDLSHLRWYIVLACYKLGIILEGAYARALAGKASMDVGESLHGAALALFNCADEWLARSPGIVS